MSKAQINFSRDWASAQFYCGIDVHKHELAVAIFARDDAGAEFTKHNVFRADPAGLSALWKFAVKYRPRAFAMEATGVYHHLVAQFLAARQEDCGWAFAVVVANPADSKGVPGRQQFDRADAETLARLLAAGVLKSNTVVVPALEDLKAIFRLAARLEVDRTALKNRAKKTLDRAGVRPAGLNLNSEWARAVLYFLTDFPGTVGDALAKCLEEEGALAQHRTTLRRNAAKFAPYAAVALSPTQQALLRQDLVELEFKTARKALLAVQVDIILATRPGLQQLAGHLASVPGFSPFSAAWLLAEVGPAARYQTGRAFLAFCGCCPRVVSSAGRVYSAHITRRSNKYARTIFYNAARVAIYALKEPSGLRDYAQRVLARKATRSPKLAIMIVASKLARIAYGILRNPAPFSSNMARPHSAAAQGTGGRFCVADRKVIRRASKCLEKAGEILRGNYFAADVRRLAEALDGVLQGKA